MIGELIESNRDFHIQDSAIFMGDELGVKIFTANLDAKGPKARLNWEKKRLNKFEVSQNMYRSGAPCSPRRTDVSVSEIQS
jgi:hypothetical protein